MSCLDLTTGCEYASTLPVQFRIHVDTWNTSCRPPVACPPPATDTTNGCRPESYSTSSAAARGGPLLPLPAGAPSGLSPP
jgi:hypothetical protein